MQFMRKPGVFNPHETARAESLAGMPLAAFGQRLSAYLIDIVLVFGTYKPAMDGLHFMLFNVLGMHEELYRSAHVHAEFRFDLLSDVAWVLWLVLYFGIWVWRSNGQTLGKRLLRIRIVSLTHERITFWQSAERALGYGASALEAGFGFLQYFIYPNHRCVHDRIAETIVIAEPAKS
jgi:uncharacterized RDD family membrane protein YckC